MNATETMPRATLARILHHLAGLRYMKLELGTIAAQHHITLADLQTLLNRHGYPDQDVMRKHARQLEAAAAAAESDKAQNLIPPDVTPEPEREAADQADDEGDELGTLLEVPVGKIYPDPDNPRDHLPDIDELADSIAETGLLQPIVVRRHKGNLVVVAGHRRLAALKRLKWTHAPCIIRDRMRPDQVLAAMLIENGQRVDLDPIEEARGLARLKIQWDCSDLELARRLGRSQPSVSARLALLSLTAEEQAQVRSGDLKIGDGAKLGRLNSGRVRGTGQDKNWHFSPIHSLAAQAKARCDRLAHPKGRRVGSMACGACWESVVRTDEREHLQETSIKTGKCPTCDTHLEGDHA